MLVVRQRVDALGRVHELALSHARHPRPHHRLEPRGLFRHGIDRWNNRVDAALVGEPSRCHPVVTRGYFAAGLRLVGGDVMPRDLHARAPRTAALVGKPVEIVPCVGFPYVNWNTL